MAGKAPLGTIADIKARHWGDFFSKENIDRFQSQDENVVMSDGEDGGAYFVTRQQFENDPREWRVWHCAGSGDSTGEIEPVSTWFPTRDAAMEFLNAVKGEPYDKAAAAYALARILDPSRVSPMSMEAWEFTNKYGTDAAEKVVRDARHDSRRLGGGDLAKIARRLMTALARMLDMYEDDVE
jgi:hypothetical protein